MAKKVVNKLVSTAASQITPVGAREFANSIKPHNNPQTGSIGNANINPYNNAYESYKTNLRKSKEAQLGQLKTEYNQQQNQIEGNYQNLNRNAYVTYMQRQLANRQAASNMGVSRDGAAENMQTANAVDYNRSVGNLGAYRVAQLSNAENAYNTNVANVRNDYAKQFAEANLARDNANIARRNELADINSQQAFTAKQNSLDRKQQAYEANRTFKANKMENKFKIFQDTISGYGTVKSVNKAIKSLQTAKKNGTLKPWQREYYSEMMYTLKMQKNVAKQRAKAKKKS